MSRPYQAINWTPFKRAVDNYLWVGISTYLVLFTLASFLFTPSISLEVILIRATGTAAYLLLHVILAIGPLCRLDNRFLPLLYNRRHMGVSCFLLAFVHATMVVFTYHVGSDIHPIVSVFVSDSGSSVPETPFQAYGAISLFILFIMAATSHDFWLKHLSPPVWKTIHMMVYLAYAFMVAHVVYGILQSEKNIGFSLLIFAGVCIVCGLHFVAAVKGLISSFQPKMNSDDDYVETVSPYEIPENKAKTIQLHGENVAIFRYDNKISVVSAVCEHQNAPLGEGRIIDGYIISPWHGIQYDPADGCSPHPRNEKIPTFDVKIVDDKIWINHKPKIPGTYVEPAKIKTSQKEKEPTKEAPEEEEFFIGWEQKVPPLQRKFLYNRLIGIFAFVFSLAIIIPAFQKSYGFSFHQSVKKTTVEGTFIKDPFPSLLVQRPGNIPNNQLEFSHYLLSGPMLFGFPSGEFEEFDGKNLRVRGSLIYTKDQTMVEVNPKDIDPVAFELDHKQPKMNFIGRFNLLGEIASSKSYYGAHNPGYGKILRATAVRSIAGGIPPVLIIEDANGEHVNFLVIARDEDDSSENLDFLKLVGVPVKITGDVYRWGDKYVIETSPNLIEPVKTGSKK